ncbi:MAG: hypothetical protein GX437_00050 [Sphingobacteriales bacterium]|nr:hypothetical protein [Sphingobacteriales bacterium]
MFHGYSAYQPTFIFIRLLIMILAAVAVDLYVLRTFKQMSSGFRLALIKKGIPRLHLVVSAIFILIVLIFLPFIPGLCRKPNTYHFLFFINTLFILFYVPKIFIAASQVFHDFLSLILWFSKRYSKRKLISSYHQHKFFLKTGILLALIIFFLIMSGMFIFRYQYKTEKYIVENEQIPETFDGFKIIQLSDLHLGNFRNYAVMKKITQTINRLNPDLIVFTGDMTTFHPDEMKDYLEFLSELEAKNGKFSVLGNHDYGDYLTCYDSTGRQQLIQKLIHYQKNAGIQPLLNQHVFIHCDSDSILLAGIENWGPAPYKVYGNIEKTLGEHADFPLIILLSHDPRHWQYQLKDSFNIFLTLSGHTHGGQFGIYTHLVKWSPVEKISRYWGGLYFENDKQLIVNKGLGVIGFLGRIGIRPEISLIILKSGKNKIKPQPFN